MLSVDHFIEIFDRCDLETLRQASLVCREFENIIFGNMRLCKKFKIVLDPNKVVPNKDLSIFMPNIKVLRDTNRPYKQLRIKNINTWMTTNKQRELTGVLTKLGKTIDKLTFEKCEFKAKHLGYCLEMMPLLQMLSFESCLFKANFFPTLEVGKSVSLKYLEQFKIFNSSGSFLMYGNTHNLKSLHLQASDGEMCLDDYLLSGLQKLESLTLQTCFQSFSKDLSKVTFKLKTLIVEHSHIINEDKFFDFIKSQTQLENVQFEINNSTSYNSETFNFGTLLENFSDRAGAASRIIRRMSDKPNNTLSHIASLQYLTDLKSLKSLKLTLFDYKWSGPNMSSDQNSKLVSFALHVHQSMLIVHGPQIDYISKFSNKLSKIKKLELELPEALDNLDLANLNESWRFVGQLIVRKASNADYLGYLNMPKLRDFTISQSEKLSLSGWRQFTKKHPKLSRLFIEGGQNVNDELIEYLLQTLPLKSLRLESCDSFMFKDSTVAIISKNRGKLDELILKCPSSELSARSNEMLDEMKRNGLRYRQTTYKPSQACYSHFQFFSMTY